MTTKTIESIDSDGDMQSVVLNMQHPNYHQIVIGDILAFE